ncbi:MAG: hypothetical protein AB4041_09940 [Microcystaceae cyanobacterium]
MTILMTLSVMAYSDYSVDPSCTESSPSYLTTAQECHSNNSIVLEQFKPSFPH